MSRTDRYINPKKKREEAARSSAKRMRDKINRREAQREMRKVR